MIHLVTVLWFSICFLRSCQVLAIITSSLSCSPRYFIFKQDHLRSGLFAVEFKDHLQSGIICGATRGSFTDIRLIICKAFFAPGEVPYIGYMGKCGAKGYVFFSTLVLNWVCFFRRISYFFIIWR